MSIPIPLQDAVVNVRNPKLPEGQKDRLEGTATLAWIQYWQAQSDTFSQAPFKVTTPISLTDEAATIGATAIPTASLAPGLYRVSYAARISTAATTSSSLTVSLSWTASSVTQSISGAAMTGNTTATFQSGSVLIKVDANTPVTYATTYASVGATAMTYDLSIVLEEVAT